MALRGVGINALKRLFFRCVIRVTKSIYLCSFFMCVVVRILKLYLPVFAYPIATLDGIGKVQDAL